MSKNYAKLKVTMKCGETRKSTREGKKRMKKVCKDGEEKLVHYGATGYKHNYSQKAKKSFRARHGCDSAKDPFSPRYQACRDLWPKGKTGKT